MNKVLSVCFDVEFKGKGIVNYNGPGKKNGADHVYAKSFPIKIDEGDAIVRKPYVSRNCILHTVLEEPPLFKMLSQSPNVEDRFRVNISKYRLLRGNLDAAEEAVLKRKSSFMLTDAEPTERCDSLFDENCGKGNMGGIFSRDWVNKTHFKSSVRIDIDSLQFIPTDTQSNNATISGDDFDLTSRFAQSGKLAAIWSENYPNTPLPTVQFFDRCERGKSVPTSVFSTQGFKISDKEVAQLVIWLLDRFAALCLEKKDAYLEFDAFKNIEIRTTGDTEHFASIKELKERLDSSGFEVASSYLMTDNPVKYDHILEKINESKDATKAKKAEIKAGKKMKAAVFAKKDETVIIKDFTVITGEAGTDATEPKVAENG